MRISALGCWRWRLSGTCTGQVESLDAATARVKTGRGKGEAGSANITVGVQAFVASGVLRCRRLLMLVAIVLVSLISAWHETQSQVPSACPATNAGKIALVLPGGGVKGMAHVGVIKMLDSLGIVPDIVVGTSMGAIVGGMYASGYSG